VVTQWEGATAPAADAGIRTVHLRFGMVLSSTGGALARMIPPFRLGLGGRVGSGDQYVSWISLRDAVAAIGHLLSAESLAGPVNLVAPGPVTNGEFARALGRALGRPAVFPLPALVVRLLFGEMGRDLLLASARVRPTRLLRSGFAFTDQEIASALADLLSRRPA
jgi:uncharacterized protein (TIGR01777 family)